MSAEGWEPSQAPPPRVEFVPAPDLLEDEYQLFEVDLGSDKVVLRRGQEIRMRMNYMNSGGIKFTPDRPIWIKIKMV